jgi:hypothetical protein
MKKVAGLLAVLSIGMSAAACGDPMVSGGDAGPADTGAPPVDSGPTDSGPPPEMEPATELGDDGQEVWVYMQSHLHTHGYHECANSPLDPGTTPESICYDAAGIIGFLDEALMRQASDMIITDHNNIEAWFDPAFAPRADGAMARYATPLRGTEWSSGDGHMTLLFPTEVVADNMAAITNGWVYGPGNDVAPASADEYRNTIDSVHAVGGVAIINHPELSIHVFPEDAIGADGVEVGIPPNPLDDVSGGAVSVHSSAEARRFWQRRLAAGDRLAGTAGADHHHGGGDIPGLEAPTFGIAVNYLRIDPALPDFATPAEALAAPDTTIDRRTAIVMDAIRRGHVQVVEDEMSARVYVGADIDGDGRFHDAREGDCVLPDRFSGTAVRIRVLVTNVSSAFGSTHYNLELWNETNEADPVLVVEVDYDTGFAPNAAYEIDPANPFAIEMTVPYDAATRGFVRFVLERDVVGPANDTEVVTNPIYLGGWAAECDGSSPLY